MTSKKKFAAVLIRLPDEYKTRIADIAKDRNLELNELCSQAVFNFLDWRKSGLAPQLFFYCASSRRFPLKSVNISIASEKAAADRAEIDGVSTRQVVLTALIRLVDHSI